MPQVTSRLWADQAVWPALLMLMALVWFGQPTAAEDLAGTQGDAPTGAAAKQRLAAVAPGPDRQELARTLVREGGVAVREAIWADYAAALVEAGQFSRALAVVAEHGPQATHTDDPAEDDPLAGLVHLVRQTARVPDHFIPAGGTAVLIDPRKARAAQWRITPLDVALGLTDEFLQTSLGERDHDISWFQTWLAAHPDQPVKDQLLDLIQLVAGARPVNIDRFKWPLWLYGLHTAAPERRLAYWQQGEPQVMSVDGRQRLERIDELVKAVASLDDQALTPRRVLTDLMVRSPDIDTSLALQARRLEALLRDKRVAEARQGVPLHLALTLALGQDPSVAAAHWTQAMAAPASDTADIDVAAGLLDRPAHDDTAQAPGRVPALEPLAIEPELHEAALAALESADAVSLPRHAHTMVLLYSGARDQALDLAVQALGDAGADTPAAQAAWAQLALVLTVADAGPHRFLQLLGALSRPEAQAVRDGLGGRLGDAAPARAQDVAKLRRQWEDRLVDWGDAALKRGQDAWTTRLWALAYAPYDRFDDGAQELAHLMLSRVEPDLRQARTLEQAQPRIAMLGQIAGRLQDARLRLDFRCRLVDFLYHQGFFAACLDQIDRAETLGKRTERFETDMTLGLTRALCLIYLNRGDQAMPLLRQMADWPGSEQQHAQALFLIGWLHLAANEPDAALGIYRKLVEKYPQADPFAERARSLLEGLEVT